VNIIFIGAPGAGKGTQAELISRHYGIPTISTGNILREAVKNGTELGKKAKSYMDGGGLVPDELVIGIIRQRLSDKDCESGFILDGFPRNVPQAQALEDSGVRIDSVIEIDVPDDTISERMGGRRVCPKCGASYHVKYSPSKDGVTCDKDGETLIQRVDDKAETVKQRLSVYHEQTEPLKEFYRQRRKLVRVAGDRQIDEITQVTIKALDSRKG
jgi:adenylate kinase